MPSPGPLPRGEGETIKRQLSLPFASQLRSRTHQRFTRRGIGILLEVLNKQLRQRFRFLTPLFRGTVGVTWVRICVSTPGSAVGIARSNIGRVKVSALSREPSRMASIMARVSLMEIRLPVPFQPVLTVRLRPGGLHAFYQHFCVLRRVQRQEGRAEAGGERWGWLRHALGARQFGGKTGENDTASGWQSGGKPAAARRASAVRKITFVA